MSFRQLNVTHMMIITGRSKMMLSCFIVKQYILSGRLTEFYHYKESFSKYSCRKEDEIHHRLLLTRNIGKQESLRHSHVFH